MDLTQEQFEDLIGAYALDACEPDEVAAVEALLANDARAAAEVERLRDAAAALGAIGAATPPLPLRDRVMTVASERVPALSAQEALQAETDRFDSLLVQLDADDLTAMTHNGLNVRDLVAHVELIDAAFVESADAPELGVIGATEVAAMTSERLPSHSGEPFAATIERYRTTRARLVALADQVEPTRRLGGYGRDDTLVIRAFETWTHNDDICRATGRRAALPAPAAMRTMTELAVRSLPLAMAARGTPRPERTARLVLTGPGGGEWTLACGPGAQPGASPDVVITTSVVDLCRRFADRVAPDELPMEVDGDADLARELIGAANAFAGL